MTKPLENHIRHAAVAGLFYVPEADALRTEVKHLLSKAAPPVSEKRRDPPKALVVPHAGYMYSGQIAAHAYAALANTSHNIKKVVLLGPAHYVPTIKLGTSTAAAYRTPLGDIPVDQKSIADAVASLPFVEYNDPAHMREHSIETQLPFLQEVLGEFVLLPFLTSGASCEQAALLLNHFWGEDETLVVISTDLSHYHDYDTAYKLDNSVVDSVLRLQAEEIDEMQACGQIVLGGLLQVARQKGMTAEKMAQTNSGDVSGDKGRVVGYAAFTLYETQSFSTAEKKLLCTLARDAIKHQLEHGTEIVVDLASYPEKLRKKDACFVTLKRQGELRGCVGNISTAHPLASAIARNAVSAAFRDSRFIPLAREELAQLSISISVLSGFEKIPYRNEAKLLKEIRPGIDGLVIESPPLSGAFLPEVWETLTEPEDFVAHLKEKAGITCRLDEQKQTVTRFSSIRWSDQELTW